MRPYVAKSFVETYKSYDHMQKIGPIPQNFNEILTFENMKTIRFCHTLTNENRRNLLNFEIEGSSSGFSPNFLCSTNDI